MTPTANGSLDASFGASGQAACLPTASAMVVQSDGRIVVAGTITSQLVDPPAANQSGFALARLNPNGSIDTTFGTRGVAITGFTAAEPNALAGALALQSDGHIVAVGLASKLMLNGNQAQPAVFALARYLTGGTLDTTFGSGGRVTTAFGSGGLITATVVQSDGKIVVVGEVGGNNITVARYLGH